MARHPPPTGALPDLPGSLPLFCPGCLPAARPPADRAAPSTRPLCLPGIALAGPQATAPIALCAGRHCCGKPSMPPTGLPPASMEPGRAAPPLDTDRSPSAPPVQPHTKCLLNPLVVSLRGSAVDLRLDLVPDERAPPPDGIDARSPLLFGFLCLAKALRLPLPDCRGLSFVADGQHPLPNFCNSSAPASCSPSCGALDGANLSSDIGCDVRVTIYNAPKQLHFLTVWKGRDRAAWHIGRGSSRIGAP